MHSMSVSVLLLMKVCYFLVREKKSLQQNQERNTSGKKMSEKKSRKRKEGKRKEGKKKQGVEGWNRWTANKLKESKSGKKT